MQYQTVITEHLPIGARYWSKVQGLNRLTMKSVLRCPSMPSLKRIITLCFHGWASYWEKIREPLHLWSMNHGPWTIMIHGPWTIRSTLVQDFGSIRCAKIIFKNRYYLDISEYQGKLGSLSIVSFCCRTVWFERILYSSDKNCWWHFLSSTSKNNHFQTFQKRDGVADVTFPKIHICLNSAHSVSKLR